jgi:flagellar motility protein MotE (MotC chaperone)
MIRFARDFRLIPVVLVATISLFALKVSGLVFDGGYTLAERMQNRYQTKLTANTGETVPDYPKIVVADGSQAAPSTAAAAPTKSWAQEMFNFNESAGDITGSIKEEEKPAGPPLKVSEKPPKEAKVQVASGGPAAVSIQPGHIASPGERAVLARLQERRQELDARSREMDMRESLLKAAEKRVEGKVSELKEMEARVKSAIGARDEKETERFKSIVAMYENMKPKDAARIFDRLDLKILMDVSTRMNPRKMSEILAQMKPESAERLTVELANRASIGKGQVAADRLPKIEGSPNGG